MKKEHLGITAGRHINRPRWLSAIPCSMIPEAAKLVYCYLADCLGANTEAWPSLAAVAFNTGLNEDQIKQAIRRLREYGLVYVRRENRSKTNNYTLDTAWPLRDAEAKVIELERQDHEARRPHDYALFTQVFREGLDKWLAALRAAGRDPKVTRRGMIQPKAASTQTPAAA